MKTAELRSSVLALILVIGSGMLACRESTPPPFDDEPVDTETTGGRSGSGGRGGSKGGGAGGAAGMGVGTKPSDSGAPDVIPVATDGPVSSDVVAASDAVPVADALVEPIDAVPTVDATPPVSDAAPRGPAACYPDPKVIAICHQLEAACQNCPGGVMGKARMGCFAAVQKGDDAACAKFAMQNKCPVDDAAGKGNVCGSLNCGVGHGPAVAAGCNKVACATAQGEGDSAKCMPFLAACPCK
jgi:hypothetical protein